MILCISPTAFIAARAASRLAFDIPAFAGLPSRKADWTATVRRVISVTETTHTQNPAIAVATMNLPRELFFDIGASAKERPQLGHASAMREHRCLQSGQGTRTVAGGHTSALFGGSVQIGRAS